MFTRPSGIHTDEIAPPSPTKLARVVRWPEEVYHEDLQDKGQLVGRSTQYQFLSVDVKRSFEQVTAAETEALRQWLLKGGSLDGFVDLDEDKKLEWVPEDSAAALVTLENLDPGWLPWRSLPHNVSMLDLVAVETEPGPVAVKIEPGVSRSEVYDFISLHPPATNRSLHFLQCPISNYISSDFPFVLIPFISRVGSRNLQGRGPDHQALFQKWYWDVIMGCRAPVRKKKWN